MVSPQLRNVDRLSEGRVRERLGKSLDKLFYGNINGEILALPQCQRGLYWTSYFNRNFIILVDVCQQFFYLKL